MRGPDAEVEPEAWLLVWFEGRGESPKPNENYFEAGHIDSLGVIELIEEIEKYWGIAFHQRDFQDRRFSTISGLAEIVHERLQQG